MKQKMGARTIVKNQEIRTFDSITESLPYDNQCPGK